MAIICKIYIGEVSPLDLAGVVIADGWQSHSEEPEED